MVERHLALMIHLAVCWKVLRQAWMNWSIYLLHANQEGQSLASLPDLLL